MSLQVSLWRRVDAAFGRTGIPSFILESVLGELQAACSRHLSKLAVGMSLELSATSERKTVKKAAGKGARKGSKKGKTAAGSSFGESEELSESDNDESSSAVAELAAAAAAAGSASLKEEISKVIRVRAAGGEMRQRSVAQLSGGEKKRVALALGLGFAELAAARARLSSNVLVLDEVSCLCNCFDMSRRGGLAQHQLPLLLRDVYELLIAGGNRGERALLLGATQC
jgi:hypothetical protein